MKSFYILLLSGLATCASAQVNVSTIRTPYGNATVHTYKPQNYFYGSTTPRPYRGMKHKFYAEMIDGRQLMANTWIDMTDSVAKLVIDNKTDSIVIRPVDTKMIVTMLYRTNERMEGIPADSCWLFKIVKGPINGYSPFAEKDAYLIAIQKEDGPIVPLNKKNLVELVGTTDPKINKLIEKDDFQKAITTFNKNVVK